MLPKKTCSSSAELYQRHNGKLERITNPGTRNRVVGILDAAIKLDDYLRAVGNYYGALSLESQLGRGGVWLQERVDGGSPGSCDAAGRALDNARALAVADAALGQIAPLTHSRTRPSKYKRGDFLPITAGGWTSAICVHGQSLTQAALTLGWWQEKTIHRKRKNQSQTIREIPKRQHEMLHAYLVTCLDAIATAWKDDQAQIVKIVDGLEIG